MEEEDTMLNFEQKQVLMKLKRDKIVDQNRLVAYQIKLAQFKLELAKAKEAARNINSDDENELIAAAKQPKFKIWETVKCLPEFCETDEEMYLNNFEKIDTAQKWDKSEWASILIAACKGTKAMRAIYRLNSTDIQVFENLKKAILEEYVLVPEVYRSKFHNYTRRVGDNWAKFATYMSNQLDRWLRARTVTYFDDSRELILVEQFLSKLPDDTK